MAKTPSKTAAYQGKSGQSFTKPVAAAGKTSLPTGQGSPAARFAGSAGTGYQSGQKQSVAAGKTSLPTGGVKFIAGWNGPGGNTNAYKGLNAPAKTAGIATPAEKRLLAAKPSSPWPMNLGLTRFVAPKASEIVSGRDRAPLDPGFNFVDASRFAGPGGELALASFNTTHFPNRQPLTKYGNVPKFAGRVPVDPGYQFAGVSAPKTNGLVAPQPELRNAAGTYFAPTTAPAKPLTVADSPMRGQGSPFPGPTSRIAKKAGFQEHKRLLKEIGLGIYERGRPFGGSMIARSGGPMEMQGAPFPGPNSYQANAIGFNAYKQSLQNAMLANYNRGLLGNQTAELGDDYGTGDLGPQSGPETMPDPTGAPALQPGQKYNVADAVTGNFNPVQERQPIPDWAENIPGGLGLAARGVNWLSNLPGDGPDRRSSNSIQDRQPETIWDGSRKAIADTPFSPANGAPTTPTGPTAPNPVLAMAYPKYLYPDYTQGWANLPKGLYGR